VKSRVPDGSTVLKAMAYCRYSVEVNVWMMRGQDLVAMQRSSNPIGLPETGSVSASQVSGASPPGIIGYSYCVLPVPGVAKRSLTIVRLPARWVLAPSNTVCPLSSRLNPSCRKLRIRLPPCESPTTSAKRTAPANGLAVPASSFVACRKNEAASRIADRPSPMMIGFLAV
jgi:hypothetical protein